MRLIIKNADFSSVSVEKLNNLIEPFLIYDANNNIIRYQKVIQNGNTVYQLASWGYSNDMNSKDTLYIYDVSDLIGETLHIKSCVMEINSSNIMFYSNAFLSNIDFEQFNDYCTYAKELVAGTTGTPQIANVTDIEHFLISSGEGEHFKEICETDVVVPIQSKYLILLNCKAFLEKPIVYVV